MKKIMSGIIFVMLITILSIGFYNKNINNNKVLSSKVMEKTVNTVEVKEKYSLNSFKEKLRLNMKYNEVVDIFGEPDLSLGYGFIIVGYILDDGRVIAINFRTGREGVTDAWLLEEGSNIENQKIIEDIDIVLQ